MNLLDFNKRFNKRPYSLKDLDRIGGYMDAITDMMKMMYEITKADPKNRAVDSLIIVETIMTTNTAIMEKMQLVKSDLIDHEKN